MKKKVVYVDEETHRILMEKSDGRTIGNTIRHLLGLEVTPLVMGKREPKKVSAVSPVVPVAHSSAIEQ
jgi:hypothetical protein